MNKFFQLSSLALLSSVLHWSPESQAWPDGSHPDPRTYTKKSKDGYQAAPGTNDTYPHGLPRFHWDMNGYARHLPRDLVVDINTELMRMARLAEQERSSSNSSLVFQHSIMCRIHNHQPEGWDSFIKGGRHSNYQECAKFKTFLNNLETHLQALKQQAVMPQVLQYLRLPDGSHDHFSIGAFACTSQAANIQANEARYIAPFLRAYTQTEQMIFDVILAQNEYEALVDCKEKQALIDIDQQLTLLAEQGDDQQANQTILMLKKRKRTLHHQLRDADWASIRADTTEGAFLKNTFLYTCNMIRKLKSQDYYREFIDQVYPRIHEFLNGSRLQKRLWAQEHEANKELVKQFISPHHLAQWTYADILNYMFSFRNVVTSAQDGTVVLRNLIHDGFEKYRFIMLSNLRAAGYPFTPTQLSMNLMNCAMLAARIKQKEPELVEVAGFPLEPVRLMQLGRYENTRFFDQHPEIDRRRHPEHWHDYRFERVIPFLEFHDALDIPDFSRDMPEREEANEARKRQRVFKRLLPAWYFLGELYKQAAKQYYSHFANPIIPMGARISRFKESPDHPIACEEVDCDYLQSLMPAFNAEVSKISDLAKAVINSSLPADQLREHFLPAIEAAFIRIAEARENDISLSVRYKYLLQIAHLPIEYPDDLMGRFSGILERFEHAMVHQIWCGIFPPYLSLKDMTEIIILANADMSRSDRRVFRRACAWQKMYDGIINHENSKSPSLFRRTLQHMGETAHADKARIMSHRPVKASLYEYTAFSGMTGLLENAYPSSTAKQDERDLRDSAQPEFHQQFRANPEFAHGHIRKFVIRHLFDLHHQVARVYSEQDEILGKGIPLLGRLVNTISANLRFISPDNRREWATRLVRFIRQAQALDDSAHLDDWLPVIEELLSSSERQ